MKKVLTVLVLVAVLLVVAGTTVKATTEAELVTYLTTSHKIAGKNASLTSLEIKQVKDFFADHDITDEQAAYIKEKVDACIKILDDANTIDVTKLSKSQKQALMGNAEEAAYKIGLTVDTTTGIVRDVDGTVVFVLPEGKLVQTGANYIPYAILAGVAIIAVAGTVIYKKARA